MAHRLSSHPAFLLPCLCTQALTVLILLTFYFNSRACLCRHFTPCAWTALPPQFQLPCLRKQAPTICMTTFSVSTLIYFISSLCFDSIPTLFRLSGLRMQTRLILAPIEIPLHFDSQGLCEQTPHHRRSSAPDGISTLRACASRPG